MGVGKRVREGRTRGGKSKHRENRNCCESNGERRKLESREKTDMERTAPGKKRTE